MIAAWWYGSKAIGAPCIPKSPDVSERSLADLCPRSAPTETVAGRGSHAGAQSTAEETS